MNQPLPASANRSPKITLLPVNPDDKIAQWDGNSTHSDGIIAVIGYEDYLQNILMCRFLKEIKNHFSKVYLLVPRVLVDLLQDLEGCDGIYEFEGEVPKVTHHITLVEGLKKLSLSADGEPYIKLDDATLERWQKRIPDRADDHDGLRVGLVWDLESAPGVQKLSDQTPEQLQQPQVDNRLNFLLMSNFLRIPTHEFYSLQIGGPAVRNHIYNFSDKQYFVDLFPYITDFNEMAGAISRLDLVIAGDSAAAHLAASMGCNVWLLSSQEQAWYWQLEAKQINETEQKPLEEGQVRTRGTMWYKSMQLILQEKPGDWAAPLQILMNNLAKLRRKPAGEAEADDTKAKKGKKKA